MSYYYRGTGFAQTPPVIKNLVIINVIVFALTKLGIMMHWFNLYDIFSLYYPDSEKFKPLQFVTHMFMHGDIMHILLNMFMLWMFGRILENVWGGKRLFIYYMITGLGAALLHTFVNFLEFNSIAKAAEVFTQNPTPAQFALFVRDKFPMFYDNIYSEFLHGWFKNPGNNDYIPMAQQYISELTQYKLNIPTVGASGAVYGVLLAFGMTFPNVELYLMFFPFVPIKAKYMVVGMGVLELLYGVSQPGSNIAHFAHLGGMIFGFILIKYWKKTTRMY